MYIEHLQPRQQFTLDMRPHVVHSVELFNGRAWVETTTGTLISERLGTFVETQEPPRASAPKPAFNPLADYLTGARP